MKHKGRNKISECYELNPGTFDFACELFFSASLACIFSSSFVKNW
jgi:hypothetical protein